MRKKRRAVKKTVKKKTIRKKTSKKRVARKKQKRNVRSVLEEQISLVTPDKDSVLYLNNLTNQFTNAMKKELKNAKTNAEVFVGGSFAKGTMVKKEKYDIDILLRFDWRHDAISDLAHNVLKNMAKNMNLKLERVHGSRDYFKIYINEKKNYFEIIPVTKIKKVHEEKNVTDLSYFHVPYVKKKIRGLENELRLAKTFCHAQRVYGAETYVKGFSGYALECLIIYYKSFLKMLRELSKVKTGDRLVIDIEKKYKKSGDVFIEMNENKLYSPVILVDPTYKERNAIASLSHETFKKFQKAAKAFLKKPSAEYFVEKEIDVKKLKKLAKGKNKDLVHLQIKTNKQKGDIAGTKLKKFSEFIERELDKYFKISRSEFYYDEEQNADLYLVVQSRKEVVRIGPPLHMKKHVRAFKKEHMNTYEKNKFVHAKIKVNFDARSYLNTWKKQRANKRTIDEMGVISLKVGG